MNDSIKIAGTYTISNWNTLRQKLIFNWDDQNLWESAYDIYFIKRIETRFLNPIKQIKSIDEKTGEGFSIALISVVLLEFIAAFQLGKIYKYNPQTNKTDENRNLTGPHEYNSSINLLK
jgi:hypothetical protein